jgi:hypothetical protein
MPGPAAVQTEHQVRCSTATKGHVTTTTKHRISNHVVCHSFFVYFFGRARVCWANTVGHSCVYDAHSVFWRDVWIRTKRPAVGAFVSVT